MRRLTLLSVALVLSLSVLVAMLVIAGVNGELSENSDCTAIPAGKGLIVTCE